MRWQATVAFSGKHDGFRRSTADLGYYGPSAGGAVYSPALTDLSTW